MSESFNVRLKRLRTERNLSAAEMARLIRVAPTTYREWEYGRGMKFPPFLEISQVLAISVTELVTGQKIGTDRDAAELECLEKKLRELRLKWIAMR
jgi:transcriptional regulator with XRE-family HTH domain